MTSLLDMGYVPPNLDLATLEPDGPAAYALARSITTSLVKQQEARFKEERANTFDGEGLRDKEGRWLCMGGKQRLLHGMPWFTASYFPLSASQPPPPPVPLLSPVPHGLSSPSRPAPERMSKEFGQLVKSFSGPDGLEAEAWQAMTRKLELMASRQIQRQDSLALEQ